MVLSHVVGIEKPLGIIPEVFVHKVDGNVTQTLWECLLQLILPNGHLWCEIGLEPL